MADMLPVRLARLLIAGWLVPLLARRRKGRPPAPMLRAATVAIGALALAAVICNIALRYGVACFGASDVEWTLPATLPADPPRHRCCFLSAATSPWHSRRTRASRACRPRREYTSSGRDAGMKMAAFHRGQWQEMLRGGPGLAPCCELRRVVAATPPRSRASERSGRVEPPTAGAVREPAAAAWHEPSPGLPAGMLVGSHRIYG